MTKRETSEYKITVVAKRQCRLIKHVAGWDSAMGLDAKTTSPALGHRSPGIRSLRDLVDHSSHC
jgi:hypothetical protein